MQRIRKAFATTAIIVTAVFAPVANPPVARPDNVAATAVEDPQPVGVVPDSTTALIVLCFPGAGCIVCHNGSCEYTVRV